MNARNETLIKLYNKLARSTYAIIDYDVLNHFTTYKPKITKSEARKLKQACSKAIDAALEGF